MGLLSVDLYCFLTRHTGYLVGVQKTQLILITMNNNAWGLDPQVQYNSTFHCFYLVWLLNTERLVNNKETVPILKESHYLSLNKEKCPPVYFCVSLYSQTISKKI